MQNDKNFIECSALFKDFPHKNKTTGVLKGLDLTVKKGEIVVVSGRNGAGKSTLLGLLAGLERPTAGKIIFDEVSLNELSNEELASLRRDKIGMIFQNFNLLPSWTAFENVQAALMHRGIPEKEQRARITTLLDRFGLKERYDNLPSELSVGEQQRVAVARALAGDPRLILADEPTGDVDPENAEEITDLLISAVREKGSTMILATHASAFFENCDRILRLRDGALTRELEN